MLKTCGYVFFGLAGTILTMHGNEDDGVMSPLPSSVLGGDSLQNSGVYGQESSVYEPTVRESRMSSAPSGKPSVPPSANVSLEEGVVGSEAYQRGLDLLHQGKKDEALKEFIVSAKKGHLDAMLYAAQLEWNGKRNQAAFDWYQKLLSCKDKEYFSIAANALGLMHERGQVPGLKEKDLVTAKEFFELANGYGLPAAKENLERLRNVHK